MPRKATLYTVENAEKFINLLNAGTPLEHITIALGITPKQTYALKYWAKRHQSKFSVSLHPTRSGRCRRPRKADHSEKANKLFELMNSGETIISGGEKMGLTKYQSVNLYCWAVKSPGKMSVILDKDRVQKRIEANRLQLKPKTAKKKVAPTTNRYHGIAFCWANLMP